MHRNMQNTLIHSIHQSTGVVMEKFLELVAEEIEFSANDILKDIQNKKRRPARPTHCPLKMCWSFPYIRRKVLWNGATLISRAISIIYKLLYYYYKLLFNHIQTYNCDCSKTKIMKLNHLYLYDIQNDHI